MRCILSVCLCVCECVSFIIFLFTTFLCNDNLISDDNNAAAAADRDGEFVSHLGYSYANQLPTNRLCACHRNLLYWFLDR